MDNLAMVGGLLMFVLYGGGALSVDGRVKRPLPPATSDSFHSASRPLRCAPASRISSDRLSAQIGRGN